MENRYQLACYQRLSNTFAPYQVPNSLLPLYSPAPLYSSNLQALSQKHLYKPVTPITIFLLLDTLSISPYIYIATTVLLELRLNRRGGSVTEPNCRGLYRRTPCSYIHLVYSLCQLHKGISPPYALDPYNQLRNVLQTPRIHTLCSHCPRSVTHLVLRSQRGHLKGADFFFEVVN